MKKLGFTIAEVLVTLGIIGVVSAISLPTLITSHKNQSCAAALAVAVSNFEKGMSTLTMKQGQETLYQTDAWKAYATPTTFAGNLDGSIALTYNPNKASIANYYDGVSLKNIKGSNVTVANITSDVYAAFTAKNGVAYFINFKGTNIANGVDSNAITEQTALANGVTLTDSIATVIIDVNGVQKPNIVGRDLFLFDLSSLGILYPAGGLDFAYKNEGTAANKSKTWRDAASSYTCNDSTKDSPGWGCTARLIEENYKPKY